MGKNQSLMPWPLVLASTSKYRSALLSQLGWPFTNMAPNVDEDVFKRKGLSPSLLAQTLAEAKAMAVFAQRPHTCVIGSDQVCTLDEKILSKPVSRERAIEQLLLMQGRRHELLTAVTIISPREKKSILNRTTLHMRPLSTEQVESYVDDDLPLDCAGSYKLESKGIKLFEKIEMSDYTSIIGLPLIDVTSVLLTMGYSL